jgi:hypothetical protein
MVLGMGVTIHYRGKIDNLAKLPDLIGELTDIAEWMGWQTSRIDDDWPATPNPRLVHRNGRATIEGELGLKGIVLRPGGECESLEFLFDQKGYLRSVMGMVMIADGSLRPEDALLSTKTRFAGAEVHIRIVGVLKYIAKKYISGLEVNDEGGYWETGDRTELERRIGFIQRQLDHLERTLRSPRVADYANATADELVELIVQILQEGPKGGVAASHTGCPNCARPAAPLLGLAVARPRIFRHRLRAGRLRGGFVACFKTLLKVLDPFVYLLVPIAWLAGSGHRLVENALGGVVFASLGQCVPYLQFPFQVERIVVARPQIAHPFDHLQSPIGMPRAGKGATGLIEIVVSNQVVIRMCDQDAKKEHVARRVGKKRPAPARQAFQKLPEDECLDVDR